MAPEVLADKLRQHMAGRVETGVPLARFTTYRLGGPALLFVEPSGEDDLRAVSELLESEGGPDELPVLVVGRGSNLVISDHGFPGVVVHLGAAFNWIRFDEGSDTRIAAGGAGLLPQVANWTARRSLTGFEWTISIPGSVGGGVRMNAGAHGSDMSESLVDAVVWRLDVGTVETVPNEGLDYSYRRSNLAATDVVLQARFQLERAPEDAIRARIESFRKHRAETQPGALQNAGSVFKNPSGDSAGRLVEAAGLKGFSVGGASVSELHANFFIAGDGALAQDVKDLVEHVRGVVKDVHGVELEPEIRFIGEFR